jgi:hypothetical protein
LNTLLSSKNKNFDGLHFTKRSLLDSLLFGLFCKVVRAGTGGEHDREEWANPTVTQESKNHLAGPDWVMSVEQVKEGVYGVEP